MLNPLALPQAVIDSLTVLPAIARDARRATQQMDQMLERADRLIEQTDRLLERFDAAEQTIAELVEGGRRLEAMGASATAEAAAVRESLDKAIPTAEELSRQSGPILEMSAHARDELAKANAAGDRQRPGGPDDRAERPAGEGERPARARGRPPAPRSRRRGALVDASTGPAQRRLEGEGRRSSARR